MADQFYETLSLAVTLAATSALGWLGWQLLKQERALDVQRAQESLENAADEPWDYTKTELAADDDLQKRLYEAYFNVWYGNPHLGGFMIWEWSPGEPEEKGYSPKGKPAEQVMRDWFAKKPWKVE